MTFITISRESGSFGEEIAEKLAADLHLPLISRSVVMNE
ncbi:MAG TPA: cytidylate kinase-like family protein, partial [Clostridiales bacterium]|nr:cytidylate kinase-like family protein [Clostridiales bacterium]